MRPDKSAGKPNTPAGTAANTAAKGAAITAIAGASKLATVPAAPAAKGTKDATPETVEATGTPETVKPAGTPTLALKLAGRSLVMKPNRVDG